MDLRHSNHQIYLVDLAPRLEISVFLVPRLPKSLFAQFHRAANIYFLFVSIIVCLPDGPMMWSSTVVPFIGVLLWTACKDLYEDMRRKKDDDAENLRMSPPYG